jgi:hypothetical protein
VGSQAVPLAGLPAAKPQAAANATELPPLWADHPPNHLREHNVKQRYLRTTFDTRSAWALFDNVQDLRERATYKMYRCLFRLLADQG